MLQNSKQDIADVFRGKIERRLVWLMSLKTKNGKENCLFLPMNRRKQFTQDFED